MSWPAGTQRVLIVLAAALFALGVLAGGRARRRQTPPLVSGERIREVRLDLNRASPADLETLPGIGTALAARIVARRVAHGPFRCVDELRQVPGFGERLIANLRPLLAVGAVPRRPVVLPGGASPVDPGERSTDRGR